MLHGVHTRRGEPYQCLKKRGEEMGKTISALRRKLDAQTVVGIEHTYREAIKNKRSPFTECFTLRTNIRCYDSMEYWKNWRHT